MEGRWNCSCGEDVNVPVVPCDDAAVRRGADKLISDHGISGVMARMLAVDVLRAAGEMVDPLVLCACRMERHGASQNCSCAGETP